MNVAIIRRIYPPLPEEATEFLLDQEPGYGSENRELAYQHARELASRVPPGETVFIYDNRIAMSVSMVTIMDVFAEQGIQVVQLVYHPIGNAQWMERDRNLPGRVQS